MARLQSHIFELAENATYSEVPYLWPGLQGIWVPALNRRSFDKEQDGNSIQDFSTYKRHGILKCTPGTSQPTWERNGDSLTGWWLRFTGSGSGSTGEYIKIGKFALPGRAGGHPGITMSCRVEVDGSTPSDMRFMTQQSSTATNNHMWMMGTSPATTLRTRIAPDDANNTYTDTTAAIVEANVPHHYAATLNPVDGDVRHYLDGVLKGTYAHTDGVGVKQDATRWSRLGRGGSTTEDGDGYGTMDGACDYWALWNRALSDSEMAEFHLDPLAMLRRRKLAVRGGWQAAAAPEGGDSPWYQYNQELLAGGT